MASLILWLFSKLYKKRSIYLKPASFSQSNIHEAVKDMLPKNSELRKQKDSQTRKHYRENNVRIVYTPDQKAYWVSQNTFYCADLVDGELDPSSGKPIDTEGLSKKEIDRLLFILDNLKAER